MKPLKILHLILFFTGIISIILCVLTDWNDDLFLPLGFGCIILENLIVYYNKRENNELEDKSMNKRLYKSNQNKMLCGVCGGIAEYFEWDPTIVRLAWAGFCALGGSGILIYIIAAIIMPNRPEGF